MESPRSDSQTLRSSSISVLLTRAQQSGPLQRVRLGYKEFYVVKITGEGIENPIKNGADMRKIRELGRVLLETHERAAETLDLADRNIEYIDSTGVHYEGGATIRHFETKADEESETYLNATEDSKWQSDVRCLSDHLANQAVADDTQVPTRNLPPFMQRFLQPTPAARQGSFTGRAIKDGLLAYTRMKVQETHDIFTKGLSAEDQRIFRGQIANYTNTFQGSATELIDASNVKLKQNLTAQHIWKTMQTFFQRSEIVLAFRRDVSDIDEETSDEEIDDEESISGYSSSGSYYSAFSTYKPPEDHTTTTNSKDLLFQLDSEDEDDEFELRSSSSSTSSVASYEPRTDFSFEKPRSPDASTQFLQTVTSQMPRRRLAPFRPSSSITRSTRSWWDTPLARNKESAYAELAFHARNADSNLWGSLEESKELCRTARDKINEFNHTSLTGEELSIVKYVIEQREKGAEFSKLVAEERFDAIVGQLDTYAELGIRLSNSASFHKNMIP